MLPGGIEEQGIRTRDNKRAARRELPVQHRGYEKNRIS